MAKLGRPRGAKNRIRSVPSKASVLKSIWQRAERAKDTPLYIELVKLFEKVRLADRPPRPRGTQPDSQKGRRDAQQQARADANTAARAAYQKERADRQTGPRTLISTAPPSAPKGCIDIQPLSPEERINRDAKRLQVCERTIPPPPPQPCRQPCRWHMDCRAVGEGKSRPESRPKNLT